MRERKVPLNTYIPLELDEWLHEYCKQSDESKTNVVTEALEKLRKEKEES